MKDALVVPMLLVFVGIGVANVFKPEWFVKRSGVRMGGEMLSKYNRAGFQIAGEIFAAVATYMLYSFFRHQRHDERHLFTSVEKSRYDSCARSGGLNRH
jgi:hypothetical protein